MNKNGTSVLIEWTQPKFRRFKAEYARQSKAGADTFSFDGNEFVTAYAKYLIEYLKMRGLK